MKYKILLKQGWRKSLSRLLTSQRALLMPRRLRRKLFFLLKRFFSIFLFVFSALPIYGIPVLHPSQTSFCDRCYSLCFKSLFLSKTGLTILSQLFTLERWGRRTNCWEPSLPASTNCRARRCTPANRLTTRKPGFFICSKYFHTKTDSCQKGSRRLQLWQQLVLKQWGISSSTGTFSSKQRLLLIQSNIWKLGFCRCKY